MLLATICERDYFALNLKIRSEKTRYQYAIALRCFARSLGHEPTLDDLTDDAIARWMGALLRQTKPKLSVNTIRERVNRVLALWAWLARRGEVRKWPTVVKPEAVDPLPTAMTEEQLRRLFRSASKERGNLEGVPAEIWWPSFLGFVWCSAERKSAALAVRVEWIDFAQGVVTIPPENRKGRRKWGVYRLWPELVPLLQECLACAPRRELMWPWPKCEVSYYTAYNRILKDAGIPVDRRHKTHGLRVTHATWLKVMGGDPTRKLMHGDERTTRVHYIDPRFLPDDKVQLFVPWRS
jgi:integrase